MALLQQGEILRAWTEIRADADAVYSVVADVTRIPEWSPETVRVQWLGPDRFEAWNRRRLGRWRTVANVATATPAREFSFVVQAFGGDWTQWTYLIERGSAERTTLLTESMRMCVPLPAAAVAFEHACLFVRDRRADLQANLEESVERIRTLIEGDAR